MDKSECFSMHSSDTNIEAGASSAKETQMTQKEPDPNVVDWDGEDDPEKALNWSARRKWTYIIMLASLTLLTPFCSSMFAPGIPLVMSEFHSTNDNLASFVVSVYLLGYAVGPLVIAPMSELYGRLPVYHVNTALFILWNVGCARSTSLDMLIAFRFMTGLAGACPLTIGAGSIADCFKQEERGRVMAIYTLPVLLGPTIGPVVGGYLSEYLGWRWNFWFIIIVTSVLFIFCLVFQRESYPPAILERRARRLRKETGNQALRSALQSSESPRKLFLTAIIRPTKLLFLSPIVFGLSLLTALVYGCLYLFFTTVSDLFETVYSIPPASVGLIYLGCGAGQFIGILVLGFTSDALMRRLSARHSRRSDSTNDNDSPKPKPNPTDPQMPPEYRLPPLLPALLLLSTGLLIYGWSATYRAPFLIPLLLGTPLIGLGAIAVFLPVATYLVDAYTAHAASATAANTVLRSIGGALLPLCGRGMFAALGYGWGNTLLAGVVLVMVPGVLVVVRWGGWVRERWVVKLD